MTHHIRLLAAVALLALAADGVIAYWNINALIATERSLTSSHTRLNALESTLSMVKDAETGQRGFLLTGDEEYLAPYNDKGFPYGLSTFGFAYNDHKIAQVMHHHITDER